MVVSALVFVGLASGVPFIDVPKTCRAAQATGVSADAKAAYNGCVADENEAKQTLQKTWGRLKLTYKQSCVDGTMSLSPSYVELLTCLEMRDGGKFSGGAANVPAAPNTAPGASGARGGALGSTPASPVTGLTGTPGLDTTSGAGGLGGTPGSTPGAPGAGGAGAAGGTGAGATGGGAGAGGSAGGGAGGN